MSDNGHSEKFYLTTPIYYVNARPHIGHAYSTLVADVLARRHRLLGDDTFFLTGTDEHGQKIERSAAAAGIPPQQFADQVSKTFSDLWQRMGITNDAFIRTTDPRHKRGVQKLFHDLYDAGHIYLSTYTGQYSIGEEMFVDGPPGTIGPDGRPTETVTEENFFFRLSAFQQPLIDLIESDTLKITPESSRNEVLSFIRGGLKDLSVSRSSFTWGIPVPEAVQQHAGTTQNHVIYVWLDALANYMTAIGYGSEAQTDKDHFERYWPANLHLVGKEITRFHCVYWPAFLLALNPALAIPPTTHNDLSSFRNAGGPAFSLAAPQTPHWATPAAELSAEEHGLPPTPLSPDDLSSFRNAGAPASPSAPPQLPPEAHQSWAAKWLPKQVTANGWLLFDNAKMSKSRGNVVRTETILDAFGEHVYKKQFPDSTKREQDLFATDVLRYFLLREIPFGQDGTFSFDSMVTRYNADLANGYGNLVSRTLSMIQKYLGGSIPPAPTTRALIGEISEVFYEEDQQGNEEKSEIFEPGSMDLARNVQILQPTYTKFLDEYNFVLALSIIEGLIKQTDRYITVRAPWKLNPITEYNAIPEILGTAVEVIKNLTALVYPIMPFAASKVWSQLGLGDIEQAAKNGDLKNLQWGGLKPGTRLGPLAPIFPRADKSLPQIMADMELASATPTSASEAPAMPTEDTSQQHAHPDTHPAAPLKDQTTPTPALEVSEDPTHPAAPPRSASLDVQNPGAQVGASQAITTEREGTPPHTAANPTGIFATENRELRTENSPEIAIDDFTKIDLRVAKILVAERIPKADKLLRLEVDLGYEQRQILSGIAEHYTPEELIGRKIVIIANLAPRKMRGLESRGMLLAASEGENGKPILATFAEDIAVGTRLR